MNITEKVRDWLQLIGTFGVVASLLFVGLELQQTQSIALSNTYQNRTSATVSSNVGFMGSPEFLSGVAKIYKKEEASLTMQEVVALEFYWGSVLTLIENNHLQYQSGYLSEEHWQRNLLELRCTLSVPLFREIASNWPFRLSFKVIVMEMIEQSAGDENCWVNDDWQYPLG